MSQLVSLNVSQIHALLVHARPLIFSPHNRRKHRSERPPTSQTPKAPRCRPKQIRQAVRTTATYNPSNLFKRLPGTTCYPHNLSSPYFKIRIPLVHVKVALQDAFLKVIRPHLLFRLRRCGRWWLHDSHAFGASVTHSRPIHTTCTCDRSAFGACAEVVRPIEAFARACTINHKSA